MMGEMSGRLGRVRRGGSDWNEGRVRRSTVWPGRAGGRGREKREESGGDVEEAVC
jgi:hypothetical protein